MVFDTYPDVKNVMNTNARKIYNAILEKFLLYRSH